MKRLGRVALFCILVPHTVWAEGLATKFRVAQSSTEACLANCAAVDASCKRICPTTLGAPCISSCDSQAQTCRQACRGR